MIYFAAKAACLKEKKMTGIVKCMRLFAAKINRKAERTLGGLAGDCRGEGSLIATVLIIIVVIALAAIFREEIFGMMGRLFAKMEDGVGGF